MSNELTGIFRSCGDQSRLALLFANSCSNYTKSISINFYDRWFIKTMRSVLVISLAYITRKFRWMIVICDLAKYMN